MAGRASPKCCKAVRRRAYLASAKFRLPMGSPVIYHWEGLLKHVEIILVHIKGKKQETFVCFVNAASYGLLQMQEKPNNHEFEKEDNL